MNRFVEAAGTDVVDVAVPAGLRRFLSDRPRAAVGSVCEMCAETLIENHSHVVDLDARNLMCTCRACYLLFTSEGAGRGRFKVVPDRYLHDPDFVLSRQDWNALQIPVDMAFFFRNSTMAEIVAFYPSPAGATESTLPLESWEAIQAANPGLAGMEDDVEALLVRRLGDGFECYLVPIDRCYELVGRVRRAWKGFDGGTELWRDLDGFFADLAVTCARGRS
ncbi:MAG: DUF5947 family protein [Actinomycetota bacterium]|nr:DUF5947 family protein [Actinomycetota bacterium]